EESAGARHRRARRGAVPRTAREGAADVKRVMWVFLFLAACAKAPPAPRIEAASDRERRVDLGALWLGEERTHAFALKNGGDAPLTLGEVRSTCGCLIADVSRKDVAVGETRTLPVTFRADKSLGHVEKELRVATNDPALPWFVVTLAADVAALYEFDPPVVEWKGL